MNGLVIASIEYLAGGPPKLVGFSIEILFKDSIQYLINSLVDYIQIVSTKVMIITLDVLCLPLVESAYSQLIFVHSKSFS